MNDKIINLDLFSSYVLVKTIDEQFILVNKNDKYIGQELITNGFWEEHVRSVLKDIIRPGMNVIDIGANIGTHTILMSKLVGENGKVFAFEPSLIHYQTLYNTLMINKCMNTTIYRYGIGEKSETMYIDKKWMNTKVNNNFGALTLESDKKDIDDEEIEIKNLDSFKFDKVDFIKIDAEGMEDKVILGMKKIIDNFRPRMIVEIHDNDLLNVFNLLKGLNYEVYNLTNKIYNSRTWDYLAIPIEVKQELK